MSVGIQIARLVHHPRCKGKLLNDAAARTAIDPASKREVDKASAVIAKNETGDVFYFENEANFATYLRSNGS